MNILIVGCGRIAQHLAREFSRGEDNVVVIDKNRQALSALGERFNGQAIFGDAIEQETLEKAGIKNADIVFVITGDDNLNLVIAQIALKIYKRKKVITQVYDNQKSELFKDKGFVIVNRTRIFLETFKQYIK